MLITIIILVLSAVFFVNGKVRSDIVALCALIALLIFQILTPDEALSGFSNSVIWLIFAAFMFGTGYEKTGLGRRIALILVKKMGHRTLFLGYAVMFSELILAPVTPSNSARGAGIIYPIIRNLPPLYQSQPNDSSSRSIGSYIMWMGIVADCVTSAIFLTAMAPNLLLIGLMKSASHAMLSWGDWFLGMLPLSILLVLLVP